MIKWWLIFKNLKSNFKKTRAKNIKILENKDWGKRVCEPLKLHNCKINFHIWL